MTRNLTLADVMDCEHRTIIPNPIQSGAPSPLPFICKECGLGFWQSDGKLPPQMQEDRDKLEAAIRTAGGIEDFMERVIQNEDT